VRARRHPEVVPVIVCGTQPLRREVEVREERLIREAGDAGLEIDRRGDADPAIVLSSTLDAAAA